jgi:EmrB/QacA subfamily drug resistance transporter
MATNTQNKTLSRAMLPTLLAATFMGIIDTSIVNVASPSIQKELPATFQDVQLIFAGYIIAYGVGLVIGGRLGDIYGRKRIFQVGLLLFTIASLACAISPNASSLIISRLAQGLSGALMLPQVLSIIRALLEGPARSRALGIYGATIGVASIAGQLVGGALISVNLLSYGWRWVFLVNIPIGIVALIVSFITVPESKAEVPKKIDVLGALLLGTAIGSLIYPLIVAPHIGWSGNLSALIGLAALSSFLFIMWERYQEKRKQEPLVELDLFKGSSYRTGMLTVLTFYGANAGFYLILAFFFQGGLHLSPLGSGLGYAPLGIGFMLGSLLARRLGEKYSSRILIGGAFFKILGLIIIILQLASSPSAFALSPALFVAGMGEGLIAVTLIGKILADVSAEKAGLASGSLLTMTQLANVSSVVVTGTLFSILAIDTSYSSYSNAFRGSLIWLAVLTMVTAGLLKHLETIEKRGLAHPV